ncbi:hypothetical protein A4A49_33194 [Nicotiana attenuata]|uniref:Retrotransposon gag domain-containing protein n=1 Tax=Nicotiana attenuata TaxID=49451 RepID=A0A1J6I7K0_NICAT|nr:hypothetical protein A4A49_33194 [Nicotiana attenuata]
MTIPETRIKATEENIKKLENQLQNYISETDKKLESNDSKMDELHHKFDIMMYKIFVIKDGILGSAPPGNLQVEGSGRRAGMVEPHEQPMGRYHSSSSASRVDCPYFEDGDPRSWLRKCERYFHYNHISDPQHKLEIVVLHLNGKEESWYFSYQGLEIHINIHTRAFWSRNKQGQQKI